MQDINKLLDKYKQFKESQKVVNREYWQESCVSWLKKLGIRDKNDRKRLFKLFKTKTSKMEEICAYVYETKNVRNPTAFIFYELKRRK